MSDVKPLSRRERAEVFSIPPFPDIAIIRRYEATVVALEQENSQLRGRYHDDDRGEVTDCSVCGVPVAWGSRHPTCGSAVQKLEQRVAELEQERDLKHDSLADAVSALRYLFDWAEEQAAPMDLWPDAVQEARACLGRVE